MTFIENYENYMRTGIWKFHKKVFCVKNWPFSETEKWCIEAGAHHLLFNSLKQANEYRIGLLDRFLENGKILTEKELGIVTKNKIY